MTLACDMCQTTISTTSVVWGRKPCPAEGCSGTLVIIESPPPGNVDRSPTPRPQSRVQYF